MLTRLECTTERLRQREVAFENLYQFAPAAILSIQPDGAILEANRRAVALFGLTLEPHLVGKNLNEHLDADARETLRHTLSSLRVEQAARCELSLMVGSRRLDVLVEGTPVRNADGRLVRVRLSILDVGQIKALQRQLADKGRLLNLIVDHMSDAIMLVDAKGCIAAHNPQLASLLRRRPDSIANEPYEFETFWNDIGILDMDRFIAGMRQIEAEADRPSLLRVHTQVGVFLFQCVPMHDAEGSYLGRLWVVQEITAQEQAERLVRQQANQLDALKRMGAALRDLTDLDAMLQRIAQLMYELMGVEAVGVAIRSDHRGGRSRQIVHRGTQPMNMDLHRRLTEVAERHVMPAVAAQADVSYWPDLSRGESWCVDMYHAGLSCMAAGRLQCDSDLQGMIWIARRGGERIERQHIQFLEAMLPLIAARIATAQLHEHMALLELTDPVTSLPNRKRLEMMAGQLVKRPGYPWAAIMLNIDHFRELNDALGHEAADRLLMTIGLALRGKIRKSCHAGRLGGKQFLVLCSNSPHDATMAVAERVRSVIAELPVRLPDGSRWQLTASVGVACSPGDGRSTAELFTAAARRADAAKAAGRNCVVGDDHSLRRAS